MSPFLKIVPAFCFFFSHPIFLATISISLWNLSLHWDSYCQYLPIVKFNCQFSVLISLKVLTAFDTDHFYLLKTFFFHRLSEQNIHQVCFYQFSLRVAKFSFIACFLYIEVFWGLFLLILFSMYIILKWPPRIMILKNNIFCSVNSPRYVFKPIFNSSQDLCIKLPSSFSYLNCKFNSC